MAVAFGLQLLLLVSVAISVSVFQPVCEEPFTREMEFDDLPKERLKQLIWDETQLLKHRIDFTSSMDI